MIERRTILKGAGAALTTSLFTGRVKGANDRISVGHIGIGAMGSSNLGHALKLSDTVEPVAVCDVYKPHLDKAVATAAKAGKTVKAVKDFREVLADKSIDAVCISTPDHWHAYMSVEACKAGKDVFVEKPASVYVEEGQKMVQAARKYKRVVQAGTMQRSGGYFKKAAELVKSGIIGEVTFVHTWQSGATKKEGWGKPADGPVPEGLDWDMWLGPAPKVPFNKNRWGVGVTTFPTFRYFWDYAGGAMTDWGVHLIDPCASMLWRTDADFDFSAWATSSMCRTTYGHAGHDDRNVSISQVHADVRKPHRQSNADVCRARRGERRFTEPQPTCHRHAWRLLADSRTEGSKVEAQTYENNQRDARPEHVPHWKNFIECVKSRAKPISDIETCVRSSTACILANLSMRHKTWLDWDETNWTVKQSNVQTAPEGEVSLAVETGRLVTKLAFSSAAFNLKACAPKFQALPLVPRHAAA
jgi:predicted dehydrogenase